MPEAPPASEPLGRTREFHQQDNRFVVERHAKRVSSPSILLRNAEKLAVDGLDHVRKNISKPAWRIKITRPKIVISLRRTEYKTLKTGNINFTWNVSTHSNLEKC